MRAGVAARDPPEVEVVIEIPQGSFLKRGSTGHVDFVSPLPCPSNYGAVPGLLGLEDDLLDAVVLGPRLPPGTRVRVKAWVAVVLTDRGMTDDKLICSTRPLPPSEREAVLRYFRFYAKCKALLNLWRRRPWRNACECWCEADHARARETTHGTGRRLDFDESDSPVHRAVLLTALMRRRTEAGRPRASMLGPTSGCNTAGRCGGLGMTRRFDR
jgi:inorganic pyrophosphatase